jgi:hypothetical protein
MVATREEMLKLIADYIDDEGRCDVTRTDWKDSWKRPPPGTCGACWLYSDNNGANKGCGYFCRSFSERDREAAGRKVLIEAIKSGKLAWWEGALRVVEED